MQAKLELGPSTWVSGEPLELFNDSSSRLRPIDRSGRCAYLCAERKEPLVSKDCRLGEEEALGVPERSAF